MRHESFPSLGDIQSLYYNTHLPGLDVVRDRLSNPREISIRYAAVVCGTYIENRVFQKSKSRGCHGQFSVGHRSADAGDFRYAGQTNK